MDIIRMNQLLKEIEVKQSAKHHADGAYIDDMYYDGRINIIHYAMDLYAREYLQRVVKNAINDGCDIFELTE